MTSKKLKKIAFFALFITFSASANLVQTPGIWNLFELNGKFPDKRFEYLIESNFHFHFNEPKFLEENINRFGLGYILNPKISLWLGYDFIPTNNSLNHTYENRIWQQLSWIIFENKRVLFFSRTRLEQRWSNKVNGTSLRLREELRVLMPPLFSKRIKPEIFDEVFLNLNTPPWVSSGFVHQNRLFFGVNIWLTKISTLTIGYLNQYLHRNTNSRMTHIFYTDIDIYLQ